MKVSRLIMGLIFFIMGVVAIFTTFVVDIFKEDMTAWPAYILFGIIAFIGLVVSVYFAVDIDMEMEMDSKEDSL